LGIKGIRHSEQRLKFPVGNSLALKARNRRLLHASNSSQIALRHIPGFAQVAKLFWHVIFKDCPEPLPPEFGVLKTGSDA
jgi:hypothetical protein